MKPFFFIRSVDARKNLFFVRVLTIRILSFFLLFFFLHFQVQKPETATGTVSESPKIPHVELRPVGISKQNRPVSAPPSHMVINPTVPTSQPPSTPPSTTSPPPTVILKTVKEKEKGL